jgi:hypothetical protein
MAKGITPRTNGDRIAPVVDRGKKVLAEGVAWAREHPDEVVIGIAPWVLLTLATRRHSLTSAEALIITEVGYWSGVAALQQYRQWKTRPARPSLKEVI